VLADRRGLTLLELVVALVCTSLIMQLGLAAYASVQARVSQEQVRSARMDAIRAVRVVLRDELGAGIVDQDWTVFDPDSIRVRAFRGTGWPCESPVGDLTIPVRWEGIRAPDASKDSVLVLGGDGAWRVVDLVGVTGSGLCATWTVDAFVSSPVLLRLFESGSYHLGSGALRYRRGPGGRQPLTEDVLDGASFVRTPQGVHVHVPEPAPDTGGLNISVATWR